MEPEDFIFLENYLRIASGLTHSTQTKILFFVGKEACLQPGRNMFGWIFSSTPIFQPILQQWLG